ncbi:MAG: M20 family metallo-hydrolase [Paracoccaceae bacterium]
MKTVNIHEAEVEALLMTLAEIGRVGDTGVSRLAYSREWVEAMEVCRNFAEDAGLDVRQDAVGNLWARLQGTSDKPALVTGSHIDSQDPGGRYDGALGAVGGLVALKAIKRQMGQPDRTLEAVVLCEEEGSRFPTSGFWGSRAIVGKIAPDDLTETRSFDGEPIGDVMKSVGLDPDAVTEAIRNDIGGFIELHIEQGPILEAENLSVGLVSAINGMGQFDVVLEGQDNHAGAFPMDLRCDPMAGFAEIASSLIDHTHRMGRPAVTTIGRVEADPAGVAIVPRCVRFSIDARHPDPETRRRLYATQDRMMREICDRRGLRYSRTQLIDLEPCLSDPDILQTMKDAAAELGLVSQTMISGAGHDAQQMSLIAPVAMIFVRSEGGRSHTPDEFSTITDCTDGIRLLAQTLYSMSFER